MTEASRENDATTARVTANSQRPSISEKEADNIIQSLLEANYFDASTMAPLSPASVVSISLLAPISPIIDCVVLLF